MFPVYHHLINSSTLYRKEDPSKELTIVLLADNYLMEFPMEALDFLQRNKSIVSISRDISLQMLANKIISMRDSSTDSGKLGETKKKKKKNFFCFYYCT